MTYKIKISTKQRIRMFIGKFTEYFTWKLRYSKKTKEKIINEAVRISLEDSVKLDDDILVGRL